MVAERELPSVGWNKQFRDVRRQRQLAAKQALLINIMEIQQENKKLHEQLASWETWYWGGFSPVEHETWARIRHIQPVILGKVEAVVCGSMAKFSSGQRAARSVAEHQFSHSILVMAADHRTAKASQRGRRACEQDQSWTEVVGDALGVHKPTAPVTASVTVDAQQQHVQSEDNEVNAENNESEKRSTSEKSEKITTGTLTWLEYLRQDIVCEQVRSAPVVPCLVARDKFGLQYDPQRSSFCKQFFHGSRDPARRSYSQLLVYLELLIDWTVNHDSTLDEVSRAAVLSKYDTVQARLVEEHKSC